MTIQIEKANAVKAYKNADDKTKKVLVDLLGEDSVKSNPLQTVTSFETACEQIGEDPEEVLPYKTPKNKRQDALNDIARLDVIAEAIRGSHVVNWGNSRELKWRPWFVYGPSGFGFSLSNFDYSNAVTSVGSRLCFATEEEADHFGKTFIEIHNRLLTNNY